MQGNYEETVKKSKEESINAVNSSKFWKFSLMRIFNPLDLNKEMCWWMVQAMLKNERLLSTRTVSLELGTNSQLIVIGQLVNHEINFCSSLLLISYWKYAEHLKCRRLVFVSYSHIGRCENKIVCILPQSECAVVAVSQVEGGGGMVLIAVC